MSKLNFMDLHCISIKFNFQSSPFQIGSIEAAMEVKKSRKSDSFEFALSALTDLESYVIIWRR